MHKEKKRKNCNRIVTKRVAQHKQHRCLQRSNMVVYYEDSLESFHLSLLYLLRGNRRLIDPYILLFSLLLIISYLGGLVMRGVSALIAVDPLNRFSNGSPSLICVARGSDTSSGQTLLWPQSPDSVRDPVGDLWRYFVILGASLYISFCIFIFTTIFYYTFYMYNYIPSCGYIKCIFPWLILSFFFNFYSGQVLLHSLLFFLLPLKVVINKVTGGVFGGISKSLNLAVIY